MSDNGRCDMCDGTGEGSGGYRGICGYCNGTGEGACRTCGYPAIAATPSSDCLSHGFSEEGREQAHYLREQRRKT